MRDISGHLAFVRLGDTTTFSLRRRWVVVSQERPRLGTFRKCPYHAPRGGDPSKN